MMKIPKIDVLEKWLSDRGAEILPLTSEHEALRFKGLEVGVLYKSGKCGNKYTERAINCFWRNIPWDGRPVRTKRKSSYAKDRRNLIKRDGWACFYCGQLMDDDITVEHLDPLTASGSEKLSNKVLAHEKCNENMGTKTIVEKVNHAIKLRVELITKN
jgi:5-methylcytosine-specific restriction endonuclease McrA